MEPNQIDTCNVSSNVLNNVSLIENADASLSCASDYYIETPYYYSSAPIVSLTGTIYNTTPFSFDFSSIVYDDCFRLKSNRKRLNLKFCL